MATSITKRTGQSVLLTWEYPAADEVLIDSFLVESGPSAAGPWNSFQSVFANARSKTFSAGAVSEFYRVSAVKNGGASTPSTEVVQVVIDNTPPAPTNLSVS